MKTKRSQNNQKTPTTSAPYGETIRHIAYNEASCRFEPVYPESELPADLTVIPEYWVEAFGCYVTVPGTEFLAQDWPAR